MAKNIVGGIHPRTPWDGENIREDSPWVDFRPERIFVSMCQDGPEPCRPTVAIGERVRIRQRIGEALGEKNVDIHSGLSGTVAAIRRVDNPMTDAEETEIVILGDGEDEFAPVAGMGDGAAPDRNTLATILCSAGIVGMGGAAFPSHIKLDSAGRIDVLLVNGAECEPLVQADAALMTHRADVIVDGCLIVMGALDIPAAIVGIEQDKPKALSAMRDSVKNVPAIRVEALPPLYPAGGEKQLVLRLTGREIPEGKPPATAGVVVFNVATLAAVADAVRRGIPLTHRLCSVVGDIGVARTVRYPVGTRARDLIDFCGGWLGDPDSLVFGGPMMGKATTREDISLLKSTNGLLLINREHAIANEERPCIRCGRCSEACPMRLMPQFIDDARRREDWPQCRRLSAVSCINCGCCTYVCPSSIPLAAAIAKTACRLKRMREAN